MNKRVVVKEKSYFVDTDIFTTNLLYMVTEANNSGDEEKINRVGFAVMVLAIGIDEILKIPITDLTDVAVAIFGLLAELQQKT